MKNYYQLLGVSENATELEIQIAYKNRYQNCLHDRTGSGVNIQEKMIDILVAYNALTNNKIKQEYDQLLKSDTVDITANNPTEYTGSTFKRSKINLIRGVSITAFAVALCYMLVFFSDYTNSPKKVEKVAIAKPMNTKSISRNMPAEQKKASATHVAKQYQSKSSVVSQPIDLISKSNVPATSSTDKTSQLTDDIQQGSIKGEVLKVRGTPNAIVKFDNENEIWCYSDEKISFTKGIATRIQPN